MKPYQNPEPRKHSEWCCDLGLICEGTGCNTDEILTYDEFCFLPQTTLTKVSEGPLYGFWRKNGEARGEPRTIKEWLDDFGLQVVEPVSEQEIKDLDLFVGYDEFMDWASGIVDFNPADEGPTLFQKLKNFFTAK